MQHTKPYSIQSPESVAKEYGGNKQKIAMAAQAGIIDPTVATMAGMFIDKMRSAAAAEQSAPPTVAQQVFAPPQPPPAAGVPPQAGLAAIQQGASSAPGPSAAPPPSTGGAPVVGMAGGGLTTLPVPNDMFEEKSFAPGGIVAFADGNTVGSFADPNLIRELMAKAKMGDREALIKLRTLEQSNLGSIANADPDGVLAGELQDSFDANPAAPAAAPAAAPTAAPTAAPAPAIPFANEGSSAVSTSSKSSAPFELTTIPTSPQAPAVASIEEQMQKFQGLLGEPPKPGYLDTQAADLEAQKKQDFWTNMLAIGAGMAGSKRGSFLGAVGESLTTATPQIQKSLENQRSAKREMQKAQYEYELAKFGVKGKALESAVNQYGKDIEHQDAVTKLKSEEARAQAQLQSSEKIAQAQLENALRIAKENKHTDARFIIDNLARDYMSQGMSQTEALSKASLDYISMYKNFTPAIGAVTDLQVAEGKELKTLEDERKMWVTAGLTKKVEEVDARIKATKERYEQMRKNVQAVPGGPSAAGSQQLVLKWESMSGSNTGSGQ